MDVQGGLEEDEIGSSQKRQRQAPRRWEPIVEVASPQRSRRGKKRKKAISAEEKKAEKKLQLKKKKKAQALELKRSTQSKSAFAVFADGRRRELKASGMDIKVARETASNEWKAMTKEARLPYEEKSKAIKDRAAAAVAALRALELLKKLSAQRKAERAKERNKQNTSTSTTTRKKRPRPTNGQPIPLTADKFFESAEDIKESDGSDEADWVYQAHGGSCRRIASVDFSDDQCTLCCQGGKLVLCSSCPRAYHTKCLRDMMSDADIEVSGDLGGKALAKNKKKRKVHAPDPSALALREQSGHLKSASTHNTQNAAGDDNWHCPLCVRSHVLECVCCGESGDAETRLIPCIDCPRAYHARCGSLELVDLPGKCLAFRCKECSSVYEKDDEIQGKTKKISTQNRRQQEARETLEDALQATTLRQITDLCSKLPRDHFVSILGSRLESALQQAEATLREPDIVAKSLAALPALHSPEAVCSRLHFAAQAADAHRVEPTTASKLLKGASAGAATASAWDADGSSRRSQFALDGICCQPGAIDADTVSQLRDSALEYYEDVIHTVHQLNLEEELDSAGFATFKGRDRGRFDMVVPAFVNGGLLHDVCFGESAPWLPLVRNLLGDKARLCHVGVIIALPDAAGQKWHSDGDHVHPDLHLPPHAANVFVPLVDVSATNGATEFAPGSHADWWAQDAKLVIDAAAGDAIVFDWRLKHRGLANNSSSPRPLLYLTYALPFFVDRFNFSSDRYAKLPTLVPRLSRQDRASRRIISDRAQEAEIRGSETVPMDIEQEENEPPASSNNVS